MGAWGPGNFELWDETEDVVGGWAAVIDERLVRLGEDGLGL